MAKSRSDLCAEAISNVFPEIKSSMDELKAMRNEQRRLNRKYRKRYEELKKMPNHATVGDSRKLQKEMKEVADRSNAVDFKIDELSRRTKNKVEQIEKQIWGSTNPNICVLRDELLMVIKMLGGNNG